MVIAAWEHDISPFIIQFSEDWGIRWYGMAYVLGFVTAAWLLRIYYKKGLSPLDPNQQSDLFFAIIVGVVLGGRLGYFLFYGLDAFMREPWILFYLNQGGMASHGGFAGVALAAWLMARRFKQPFLRIGDLLVTLAPPGLLFGRLANFINGELWGKPTGSSWGVIFPNAPDQLPRYPSQLYQAGLEGVVLLVYTQLRIWKSSVLKQYPGQMAGEFLVAYSIVRVIGEQFREPDAHIGLGFAGLSRGSLLSLLTGIIGICVILYARRRGPRQADSK